MKQFEEFNLKFGDGIKFEEIDTSEINEFDQFLLTPEIIDILSSEGVSSYGKGFIWTLNPSEYVEWLNNWIQLEDRCVPFGRTAFGDIFFMRDRQPMVLNVNKGLIDYTTSNLEWFFDRYLAEDEFMEEYFNMPLYEKLSHTDLNQHECYGFNKLLSEGGIEDISNLSKKNLKDYLITISASAEEVGFYKH